MTQDGLALGAADSGASTPALPWVSRGNAPCRVLELALDRLLHNRWPVRPTALKPDDVRRILVVRNDNIGDVLCSTPALRALRRAFPGASRAILVAEPCRAVVERNPDLDLVFSYTKAKHRAGSGAGLAARRDLRRVLLALRRQRFDLAISMRNSRSCAWLAYASGAPWRLGYPEPSWHPLRFLLNLGKERAPVSMHQVDMGLELLGCLGIPPAGRQLTLAPDPAAQEAVRRKMRDAGAPPSARLACVHISNRREASRWPLAAFAEIADRLRERLGFSILLSWSPGDESNPLFPGDDRGADAVAAQMRAQPIRLRTSGLDDFIAAISVSHFLLSTDGGPMHMAAALNVPQVVIFGRTNPIDWAPVSEKCAVLKCGERADRVSVEEVWAAVVAVLSREKPDGGAARSASTAAS